MVVSGSYALFLATFRVFAGRGPSLTAAGDDALLADMPYTLPMLAVLQRGKISAATIWRSWRHPSSHRLALVLAGKSPAGLLPDGLTCGKRAWRCAVPCAGLLFVLRTFHTSR
jgi:hypothetical protein